MLAAPEPQPRIDRLVARLIDCGLWVGVVLLIGAAISRSSGLTRTGGEAPMWLGPSVLMMATIAIVIYETVMVASSPGTVGMRAVAIQVVTTEGQPVSTGRAMVRVAPLAVIGLLFSISVFTRVEVWLATLALATPLIALGLLAVAIDRPTPWDLLSGTRVVPTLDRGRWSSEVPAGLDE